MSRKRGRAKIRNKAYTVSKRTIILTDEEVRDFEYKLEKEREKMNRDFKNGGFNGVQFCRLHDRNM